MKIVAYRLLDTYIMFKFSFYTTEQTWTRLSLSCHGVKLPERVNQGPTLEPYLKRELGGARWRAAGCRALVRNEICLICLNAFFQIIKKFIHEQKTVILFLDFCFKMKRHTGNYMKELY